MPAGSRWACGAAVDKLGLWVDHAAPCADAAALPPRALWGTTPRAASLVLVLVLTTPRADSLVLVIVLFLLLA